MSNNIKNNIRPGNKKKQEKRFFERGRPISTVAQTDIIALLGDKPRQKDLLIEYLHLIQDKWSYISAVHLMVLASELKLSQAEAYEVATFYHHFDVVKENQTPPPPLTIRVCNSLSCCMAGSDELLNDLKAQTIDNTRIIPAPCMGLCDKAPAVAMGKNYMGRANISAIAHAIKENAITPVIPNYQTYDEYTATGGYALLRSLNEKTLSIEQTLNILEASGLQGLGGAGFPTAQKLRIVKDQPSPRYFCVNADEGEPGTFKDRHYLSNTPHQFLEGTLIAAHIVDARKVYIYLRDEYPAIYFLLQCEIRKLIEQNMMADDFIEIRRGAGAYICGEESAMIESIEGKRGIPRHRPPYVAQQGLFDRPTLVQNVETLYWITPILNNGAAWFKKQGVNGASGLRSYSLSGRIKKPGIVLAPAGSTISTLIELAGGMLDGHLLKAYLPGGASGGILPASLAHLPLDFGSLNEYGCFVGSHAVIVLSDQDSIKTTSLNLLNFFQDESCGQCTPCRIGCEKANQLLSEDKWDKPLLTELCTTMADASICGLGQAAPNPILSSMRYFPDDI